MAWFGRTGDGEESPIVDAQVPSRDDKTELVSESWHHTDQVEVSTVSEEALAAFANAVLVMPITDAARVLAEHDRLWRSFWSGQIYTGSLAEVTNFLRANLERDAERAGHKMFVVHLRVEEVCVQVESLVGDQVFAYRVWRTPHAVVLFARSNDTIRIFFSSHARPEVTRRNSAPVRKPARSCRGICSPS
jgi:hypothetical protein